MDYLCEVPEAIMKKLLFLLLGATFLISCNDDKGNENPRPGISTEADTLTIYFINDQHSQLDNFAKIKHIVDGEKDTNQHVLLVCAGDMFSGNPVVDQYEEKGFPMIDIMNQTGFDISVLGNHEFDYGPEVLEKRIKQAEFDWICANVNTGTSGVTQPEPYKTLEVGELKVTFLGLVETWGSPTKTIPSTHPWRVADMSFQRHTSIMDDYAHLKSEESSDVLIALTHLGTSADLQLAEDYPEFDAVIGGHSHQLVGELINGTPVLQAGSNLSYLGRLQLIITEGEIVSKTATLLNLSNYFETDTELKAVIDEYNNAAQFEEVVGFATNYLDRTELGCFYTEALKAYYQTDASFQNGGGIRADIDEGDITTLEIFNMDPFNNGSIVYTMTAREVASFFVQTGAGLHVSGIELTPDGQDLIIRDEDGNEYADDDLITIAINDYIPAVYENHFPLDKAQLQDQTTAESIIQYLKTINSTVDSDGCNQYFEFD